MVLIDTHKRYDLVAYFKITILHRVHEFCAHISTRRINAGGV